jgi:hypothetical protein
MIQGVKRFSISSRDNSWFKRLRAAAADHDDEILLEGVKHVRDALHAGWEPIALAATPGRELPAEPPEGVPLLELTAGLFSQLSDTVHAQGVAALFMRPSMSVEKLRLTPRETIVILDAVQDPGNDHPAGGRIRCRRRLPHRRIGRSLRPESDPRFGRRRASRPSHPQRRRRGGQLLREP